MRKTVEKIRIFFDGDEARRFARNNHGWISDVVGNSEVTVYQVIYRVGKGRK